MSYLQLGFQLAFRATATEPTFCRYCYGPIAKGDLVVTEPGSPTWVLHRSCWFMPQSAINANVRGKRRHRTAPAAPREQGDLFPPVPRRSSP